MITVKNQNYRVGKLNALTQFHVSRRLAPIIAAMGMSLDNLKTGMKLDLDDFASVLEPVTELMAKMSDADCNYIIFTCLGVVQREQTANKWAAVTTNGQLMFDDIDMPGMLRLVIEVLKDNLGDFLMGLGSEPISPSP